MGCHSLLQGILPTQRSNPCLLCLPHWQAGSLPAEPSGKPQRGPPLNSSLNTKIKMFFAMMIQTYVRGVGVCVCLRTNIRQKHIWLEKGYWQRSGPTFCFSICDFFPSVIYSANIYWALPVCQAPCFILFCLLGCAFLFCCCFCFLVNDFCDPGNLGNNEMVTESWV